MTLARFIAVFGGAGLMPKAPGTWGSLAALPFAYGLHILGGFPLLAIATVVVFLVGVWSVKVETVGKDDHDPSEIVIDEVAGQWIALWGLSFGVWFMGLDPFVFPWPGVVGGFVLFRLFDIWKPWPVSWADKRNDPLGVMLDDVIAGVMALLVAMVFAGFAHGWFA